MEKAKIYILFIIVALAIIIVCFWMIKEAMKLDKQEIQFKERDEKLYRRLECDCDEPNPFMFDGMNKVMCEDCWKEIKK